MNQIKVETRGRKALEPQDKRAPLTIFIPLKHHAKFKKEVQPIVKKYL
jgi:hypothetical protein